MCFRTFLLLYVLLYIVEAYHYHMRKCLKSPCYKCVHSRDNISMSIIVCMKLLITALLQFDVCTFNTS